jgi:hypothetical protein
LPPPASSNITGAALLDHPAFARPYFADKRQLAAFAPLRVVAARITDARYADR